MVRQDIGKIFKLLQKFLSQPERKKMEDLVEAGGMLGFFFFSFILVSKLKSVTRFFTKDESRYQG